MNIEIWSDIVCPFCYIGKRNLESALNQLNLHDEVELTWHSFELSPGIHPDGSQTIYEFLAWKKGISLQDSMQMHAQMSETARHAGLHYDFDNVIPANSLKAHRLLHLAAENHLQNEMNEKLFAAYFTEGKNISDDDTLIQLAIAVGLPGERVNQTIGSDEFSDAIQQDIEEAGRIGIQGVPFFVFNRQYAISGAQPPDSFVNVMKKLHQ